MSESGESFVERRRRIVRAELGRVAIELFAEQGFDAVTVDQIARAAGTSQRTFFRYFASKDDVVLDYERRLHARLVAAFDNQPSSVGAVQGLRQAYTETAHIAPADRSHVVKLGRILAAAPELRSRATGVNAIVHADLLDRVARRMCVPAESPSARTLVAAMGAVAATEYQQWIADGGQGDPADRIGAALDLLIAGLGSLDQRPVRSRSRQA